MSNLDGTVLMEDKSIDIKYSNECAHRHKEKECNIFDMTCAMLHTRIWGRLGSKEYPFNKCPYYIHKDEYARKIGLKK